jgi:uncharacterized protein YecT (DUF1311 family)
MKTCNNRVIMFILLLIDVFYANSQERKDVQMYVPVDIWSWDKNGGRLDWSSKDGQSLKDLYFNIMKPYFINPELGRKNGKSLDLDVYINGNKKLIYTRKECDSVITFHLDRLSSIKVKIKGKSYYPYKIANESLYYVFNRPEKDTADKTYIRCVCLPASEIMLMRHGNVHSPDRIWLEPSDFMKRFKAYNLDYLDIKEIPYLKRFPLDISPSFDCSEAQSMVEKTICRDVELSRLDKELNEIYQQVLQQKGDKIRLSQRTWSSQREEKIQGQSHQVSVKILKDLYDKRIKELRNVR